MVVAARQHAAVEVVDLATTSVRELNQRLHDVATGAAGATRWRVVNPSGAHAVACGLDAEIEVYPAMHGWCPPDSQVYDMAQAEKAWSRMLVLFERALA